MLSFLFNNVKSSDISVIIKEIYPKLKEFYKCDEIPEQRKEFLSEQIREHGFLPYPHIKALEELTPAEVLFCIEQKAIRNKTFKNGEFVFSSDNISPAQRAGFKDSSWLCKEQHNIKLINLAALGNGNKSNAPATFIDWLRQIVTLPVGLPEKNVLDTTVYLIPFHPREFGCAYLPTSSDVSSNLECPILKSELNLSAKEQVKLFILLTQLAGHCVIYDILPQTGRFSKIVLAKPQVARWFDINELINAYKNAIDNIVETLKNKYQQDDIKIVANIIKNSLTGASDSVTKEYEDILQDFETSLLDVKKELSENMSKKQSQQKIVEKVKNIIATANNTKTYKINTENDIHNQSATIQELIAQGFWPAPGGAWCSCGVPVFDKMAVSGDYPTFKHYDVKGNDVTHFANLDCQTPFFFVHLENGEYNNEVINIFVNNMQNLQKEYNFDGFRVDHIDHIVDEVSETNNVPISYRAPRIVLNKVNSSIKAKVPHFATLAEYMLWEKFYKEYHQDMNFDLLWGNDIISQEQKNPAAIVEDNQNLEQYNLTLASDKTKLSILKTYNNQDGEFREIHQYPALLGEKGALFKWFKYKFLPGGKNAQRPSLWVDGDESFTKTGTESVIGAEISLKREKNYNFYNKFIAINKLALNLELTREGEAEILLQEDDGFVVWIISKDPLKEALLVVANYLPQTQKVKQFDEIENEVFVVKKSEILTEKKLSLPCDWAIVSQYTYDEKIKDFTLQNFDEPKNELKIENLSPSDFFIFGVIK